jgi:hypothetical protein
MENETGGPKMGDRKVFLQVLLAMALVLSLVVPASVVGASRDGSPPDDRSISHLAADSSSVRSVMAFDTAGLNITPMVAVGQQHTVGLKSDGTVIAVIGNDYGYGQCNVGNWTDIVQVAADYGHTVGLKSDGTVVAVGFNDYGQCDVGGWTDIIQVTAGGYHTVGLRSDGTVVAVGSNGSGQCSVSDWDDIIRVAAGSSHTVGVKSDGTVVAVGYNYYGQCIVDSWTDIVQVAAGSRHTVGLKSDGTVVAVGDNDDEQCDIGDWMDIVQVTTGDDYTVGLKSDGTVAAAGDCTESECDVSDWTNITQVAAYLHTVGLKFDGTLIAAGYYEKIARLPEWNLVLAVPPSRPVLTIFSNAGGSVTTPGEGNFDYDYGTVVNLVAEPEEGHRLVNWTGDVSTVGDVNDASTVIRMYDHYSITASFEETPPPTNWSLIGGILALIVVIAGLVFFFVDRRKSVKIRFRSKIWGFVRRPATTFREVKEETLGGALKYALICLVIFGVLAGIMLALLGDLLFLLGNGWLPDNPLLLIPEVIGFSVAGGMLLVFIGGAWMHLWVHIFGGRRGHGYRQTLKALVYGATPLYMVGWVPFIGGVIGSIWAIVLTIIGLRELHGMTTGRAVGAALLAIGIAGVVVVLLVVVLLAAFLGPLVYLFIWWLALFLFMGG